MHSVRSVYQSAQINKWWLCHNSLFRTKQIPRAQADGDGEGLEPWKELVISSSSAQTGWERSCGPRSWMWREKRAESWRRGPFPKDVCWNAEAAPKKKKIPVSPLVLKKRKISISPPYHLIMRLSEESPERGKHAEGWNITSELPRLCQSEALMVWTGVWRRTGAF